MGEVEKLDGTKNMIKELIGNRFLVCISFAKSRNSKNFGPKAGCNVLACTECAIGCTIDVALVHEKTGVDGCSVLSADRPVVVPIFDFIVGNMEDERLNQSVLSEQVDRVRRVKIECHGNVNLFNKPI